MAVSCFICLCDLACLYSFQLIRRSEEHKNTTVTALCWDTDEGHVFAGDIKGVVSVIRVPSSSKVL